jgi:hypothetical protein
MVMVIIEAVEKGFEVWGLGVATSAAANVAAAAGTLDGTGRSPACICYRFYALKSMPNKGT